MIDPPTFIANYPEFSNSVAYPSMQIQFYLTNGYQDCSSRRWGSMQDRGVQLYVAHNLVLAMRRARAASTGAPPGQAQGMISAKTVDKVTIGYSPDKVALEKGGDWNLTDYGIQFLRIARMVGSGGLQL
jgi:hypothetical protein